MDAQANGVAETGGGVKLIVTQDGAFEGIGSHAGEEAAPVGNAPQTHRFGIVALEDLADGGKLAQRIRPDLAVGNVNNILFRNLQPLNIIPWRVVNADSAGEKSLQIIRGQTGAGQMRGPQRMTLKRIGQMRFERRHDLSPLVLEDIGGHEGVNT